MDVTARFPSKKRKILRRIDKQARQTGDPLERLRYVRNQMDSGEAKSPLGWWPARRIAAIVAAAIGLALLIWRIS